MAEVLFVKPGAMRPSDKGRLSRAGVVVVEVDNPGDARFVTPSMEGGNLPGGDLLVAMAKAVVRLPASYQALFGEEIARAVIAAEAKDNRP